MGNTQATGAWGEHVAYEHLASKGYAVMERNWRMGRYEIDLIAMKGNRIIFVEVKTRATDYTDPVDAVDRRKRARMIASADVYMRRYQIAAEYQFDIISIMGSEGQYSIEHIEDAFFPQPKSFNGFRF